MHIDYLIIGQGLAGSLLAWELSKRGCRILVVDPGENNASLISAGIVNPVTGMRWVKTEQADTLLPAARSFYDELSAYFGQAFFVGKPMLRIFRNAAELDHCRKKLDRDTYADYFGELNLNIRNFAGFITPFGYIEQKQCGHLLTLALLSCLRQWLLSQNRLRLTKLDYAEISLSTNGAQWRDIHARQVIFCEGYHGKQNPWFSHLPFKPAKGEILTLNTPSPLPAKIYNYGHWLLPITENRVRVGATFEWDYAEDLPSAQGKNLLLTKLEAVAPVVSNSDIVDHQAGIRPCTADRQPFVGRHQDYPQLAIFNGFGSKSSLLIPWHARCFADFLIHQTPLPSSCDSQRYPSHSIAG